jgi:SAM-dependent methyltransferase
MIEPSTKYHENWLTVTGRMTEMIGHHIEKLKKYPGPILDWGCSFGVSTREIADLLGGNTKIIGLDRSLDRLLGTDTNKRLLKAVRRDELNTLLAKDLPVSYVCGDGYYPLFADESFGLIFMMNNISELLENGKLTQQELIQILETNLKTLKTGGACIIGTTTGAINTLIFIEKNPNELYEVKQIIEKDDELKESNDGISYIADQIKMAMTVLNSKEKLASKA